MAKLHALPGNHKRFPVFYFFFICLWNSVSAVIAQNQIILQGKVIDERNNETIIGANVLLKGDKTDLGTVTDVDGLFKLNLTSLPATVIVSYIGYRPQEIEVYEASSETLVIPLIEDLNLLNEVVVVGYGTQKRGNFTGSLSSVSTEALKTIPVSSFDNALQGRAAGVQVTQTSGQPGAAVTIRIRGGNSINGGNEPLYVIDGFPVYNSNADINAGAASGASINALSTLNMGDIESIDVLKDASATAIYGARGANGVVLITTRQGKVGQNTIQYDTYLA